MKGGGGGQDLNRKQNTMYTNVKTIKEYLLNLIYVCMGRYETQKGE